MSEYSPKQLEILEKLNKIVPPTTEKEGFPGLFPLCPHGCLQSCAAGVDFTANVRTGQPASMALEHSLRTHPYCRREANIRQGASDFEA